MIRTRQLFEHTVERNLQTHTIRIAVFAMLSIVQHCLQNSIKCDRFMNGVKANN